MNDLIAVQSAEFLCRASHSDVNCMSPNHVVLLDNNADTVRIIEFNDSQQQQQQQLSTTSSSSTVMNSVAITTSMTSATSAAAAADSNNAEGSSGGSASALSVAQKIVSKDVASRLRLSPPSSSCVPNNLSLVGQYCCLRHDNVFVSVFDLNTQQQQQQQQIVDSSSSSTTGATTTTVSEKTLERKAQWLATLDFGAVFVAGNKGTSSSSKRTDLAIFGNGIGAGARFIFFFFNFQFFYFCTRKKKQRTGLRLLRIRCSPFGTGRS